jgi:acetyltransferase-like isoleucine patch superfamily enzyme/lysophospholipase L1-like esterase
MSNLISTLRNKYKGQIVIPDDCQISEGVIIEMFVGEATLEIGHNVSIMRGTTIQVHRRGKMVIGDNVAIGENVFLSCMCHIYIGNGCGISNMVDIHDHNHRDRSYEYLSEYKADCCVSGFELAPVYIESGVILSNKVTVTAGVRIGQNTKIGANSVVSRSIKHNTVAVGTPARIIRTFNGPLSKEEPKQVFKIGFFGTNIMQHFEAYVPALYDQMNLPEVGSKVTVESWKKRGYVHKLTLNLKVTWSSLEIIVDNQGIGGANSRTLLDYIQQYTNSLDTPYDLTIFGCGINDVWRKFQNRLDEAVPLDEFQIKCENILSILEKNSRYIICVSETPFALDNCSEINDELIKYNEVMRKIASAKGFDFIDVFPVFQKTQQELSSWKSASEYKKDILWSDGVHLTDLGDSLLSGILMNHIKEQNIISRLLTAERYERNKAALIYKKLMTVKS